MIYDHRPITPVTLEDSFIDNLKMKDTEFDGAYFYRLRDTTGWDVFFMKPEGVYKYNMDEENINIARYLIFIDEPIEDTTKRQTVYYKARLGKPLAFIKAHMRNGQNGIIVKESAKGYECMIDCMSKFGATEEQLDGAKFDQAEFLDKFGE